MLVLTFIENPLPQVNGCVTARKHAQPHWRRGDQARSGSDMEAMVRSTSGRSSYVHPNAIHKKENGRGLPSSEPSAERDQRIPPRSERERVFRDTRLTYLG